MACFCRSWIQFYRHTFHPQLVAGVDQAHLLICVNKHPNYIRTIRSEVRNLDNRHYVYYINQREFLNEDGQNVYEVLVVLRSPH